jgi:hypothetical protein
MGMLEIGMCKKIAYRRIFIECLQVLFGAEAIEKSLASSGVIV